MDPDKHCLNAEDEEIDEVTWALIWDRPCHNSSQECANNSVPFHAVSQVIASSNQVCLVIIQQQWVSGLGGLGGIGPCLVVFGCV